MKSFWYEQAPLSKAPIIELTYKFDHVRVVSAEWTRLNSQTMGHYRSVGEYFQVVLPEKQMTASEYAEVLATIEAAGPLHTDDELEILVRPGASGFEMTSHWIFLGTGAKFNAFMPQRWNEAYASLGELEDKQH